MGQNRTGTVKANSHIMLFKEFINHRFKKPKRCPAGGSCKVLVTSKKAEVKLMHVLINNKKCFEAQKRLVMTEQGF